MSINLVTVRTRTRGKAAKMFTFQGVGRLSDRLVVNSDGAPIRESGAELEYDETTSTDGDKTITERKIRDTKDFLHVDDVDVKGVTDKVAEVYDLFGNSGLLKDGETPVQAVIIGALEYFNFLARKAASPVPEEKEDVLGGIVAELVAAGLLISSDDKKKDTVATWRRTVTMGANAVEAEPLDYAEMTKEVKRLRKIQAEKK